MTATQQRKYFGTDGIRGHVGRDPLVPEFLTRLGYAAGTVLARQVTHPTFVIGRDTRQSGERLQNALTTGLLASGASAVDLGVIPTPGVAFLVGQTKADAGVVISASHNPVNENGIKFFNRQALKLNAGLELEIEALLDQPMNLNNLRADQLKGQVDGTNLRERYVEDLVGERQDLNLSGVRLVLDCANGAASWYAPKVFSRLGAEVVALHASPNGNNINADCGSEYARQYPEALFAQIKRHRANFAVVFDGDADRVIFVDEAGHLVDGDHILAILGDYLRTRGRLLDDVVVSTAMRNGALVNYFAERKINFIETPVGDKFVIGELYELFKQNNQKKQIGLGGEQSGHIVLMDESHTTGDGLRSAIYLLRAFLTSGRATLSELAESIHKYPQVIASAVVAEKIDLEQLEEVVALRNALRDELPGLTRLSLRYSGTESMVRLMLEADTRHSERELAEKAYTLIEAVQAGTNTPPGSRLEVLNVTRGGLIPRLG
ncbi:MAG: phosphoglucosamine mutase [Chloroflexi bacterium]|nr:phosphoglucosamine mutase [Chloroflexota bacterium]